MNSPKNTDTIFELTIQDLDALLKYLKGNGYQIYGPVKTDNAIAYAPVSSVRDFPQGWIDEQEGGTYRLRKEGNSLFNMTVGPYTWKRFLHLPVQRLLKIHRNGGGFDSGDEPQDTTKRAFIGVRGCELHAIDIQDTVFLSGPYPDTTYEARRKRIFIVAVNCTRAGGTCFCASMNTGPQAHGGDIVLTELAEAGLHVFVAKPYTERGIEALQAIGAAAATQKDIQHAEERVAETSAHMRRSVDTNTVKDLLDRNYDHRRWNDVASRCLACGNCTMVCPTCFCTSVEDTASLDGKTAERWRRWDSCFSVRYSYIHGGSIRSSVKSRYRQWLTHKFSTWVDQFGTFGCVGCGRCITWCPAGIDVTEEIRMIQQTVKQTTQPTEITE